MNYYVKAFAGSMMSSLVGSLPLVAVFLFFTLPSFEKEAFKYKNEGTSIAVQTAFGILDTFHKKEVSGELTSAEAQKAAAYMVSQLRYNGNEYLWINDLQPTMIMHPVKTELNGTDLSSNVDPNGKHIFLEMVETVKKADEGYVSYQWAKPGSDKPVDKVSFVKIFKPWNWVIGSGVYIDQVQASVDKGKQLNLLFFGLSLIALISCSLYTAQKQIKKWIIPIQKVMHKLSSESSSLTHSAVNLNETANEMQEAGYEQQSAITEISAAITEITDMIKSSSDIAAKSSLLSSQTAASAKQGQTSVEKVQTALSNITETGNETVAALNVMQKDIHSIDGVMEEIASKMSLIDDIVFQTKILSFNASVEAARAGENGKGFAVVAEEIGKLAKMSGASSQEISLILARSKQLVKEILTRSESQAQTIAQQNEKALAEGTASVEKCSTLLSTLGSQSQEAFAMSQDILEAYRSQAIGAEEILKGIGLIDTKTNAHIAMADQNKVLSEVVGSNAETLNAILKNLRAASGDQPEVSVPGNHEIEKKIA